MSDLLADAGQVPAHPSLSFPYLLIQKIGISIPLQQSLINTCQRLRSSKGKGPQRAKHSEGFSCNMGQNKRPKEPDTGGWFISVMIFPPEQTHCGCKPSNSLACRVLDFGGMPPDMPSETPVWYRCAALYWEDSPSGSTQAEHPKAAQRHTPRTGPRAGHTLAGRDCSRTTKPASPGNFAWAAGTRPAPRGRRR